MSKDINLIDEINIIIKNSKIDIIKSLESKINILHADNLYFENIKLKQQNTNIIHEIEQLKQENIKVYSVEQTENAIMLDDFQPEINSKYALIFGNEVKGVSQEAINLSDGVIEIPQLGSKHSLNISVSAGIVIWDFYQKMK